ncbi:MAG TPA: nuclear transport factor 2 family protein [Solirubrobacteraceae bacterium]|jgi:ketosteroid isomerase-like protein|nr:nuclear transport factor 2 family protein [Solirubrobacteraceae bacterium]
MFSWLAKAIITRNMARLREGDYRPLLRLDAKNIRFRFPGDSSWATELEGRDELERWLQRFVAAGLKIYPDEVIAQGPPWSMTICVRGTDHLDTDDGRVYENRYVIWGRMAWGLLREYEVYEDTQASKALDEYLVRREAAATQLAHDPREAGTADAH